MTIANMKHLMLTTIDNPYSPFKDYYHWEAFDREKGYYTSEYLARIAHTSDEISEDQQLEDIQLAMYEIIKMNLLGIYILIDEDYVPNVREIKV